MAALAHLLGISIHALREEGDSEDNLLRAIDEVFLSTPSARRATGAVKKHCKTKLFLSTPSARRATGGCLQRADSPLISIHALREEGDSALWRHCPQAQPISIHALREEGDLLQARKGLYKGDFYPRPPRGGRQTDPLRRPAHQEISIHALREEGDLAARTQMLKSRAISIHALREEGDFQKIPQLALVVISIHALREEGDSTSVPSTTTLTTNFYPRPPRGGRLFTSARPFWATSNFYPRPPRGGRRHGKNPCHSTERFLSTPSARRATGHSERDGDGGEFLSTPSARRATRPIVEPDQTEEFLSTPSARRATYTRKSQMLSIEKISIHALREEGDRPSCTTVFRTMVFLSTPSARRATAALRKS